MIDWALCELCLQKFDNDGLHLGCPGSDTGYHQKDTTGRGDYEDDMPPRYIPLVHQHGGEICEYPTCHECDGCTEESGGRHEGRELCITCANYDDDQEAAADDEYTRLRSGER